MHKHFHCVIYKEIVTEFLAVTDMTAVTSAVLFRSESKGSGFHASERPYINSEVQTSCNLSFTLFAITTICMTGLSFRLIFVVSLKRLCIMMQNHADNRHSTAI